VNNGPLEAKKLVNQLKSMSGIVATVSTRPRGELVVTLDNGQVWVQNQAADFFTLKTGDRVEISVGALGSYTMWVPSIRRASKVTRID
jgi:fumarylacetoacetate (FAA) hydrolase family protein